MKTSNIQISEKTFSGMLDDWISEDPIDALLAFAQVFAKHVQSCDVDLLDQALYDATEAIGDAVESFDPSKLSVEDARKYLMSGYVVEHAGDVLNIYKVVKDEDSVGTLYPRELGLLCSECLRKSSAGNFWFYDETVAFEPRRRARRAVMTSNVATNQ